jgi:hypothetical protein
VPQLSGTGPKGGLAKAILGRAPSRRPAQLGIFVVVVQNHCLQHALRRKSVIKRPEANARRSVSRARLCASV